MCKKICCYQKEIKMQTLSIIRDTIDVFNTFNKQLVIFSVDFPKAFDRMS